MLLGKLREVALKNISRWGNGRQFLPVTTTCHGKTGPRFSSSSSSDGNNDQQNFKSHAWFLSAAAATWCVLGAAMYWRINRTKLQAAGSQSMMDAHHDDSLEFVPGDLKRGMNRYTRDEVSEHRHRDQGGAWATYRHGIYDLDSLASEHRGGLRLFAAAGGPLEYWYNKYSVHNEAHVLELAEDHRVGNVREVRHHEEEDKTDPYFTEPVRKTYYLYPRSKRPWNSEPNPPAIVEHYITPTDMFFVRNHHPVPVIDKKRYRLIVEGPLRSAHYKFCQLEDYFKKKVTTATLQCASNRRDEMMRIRDLPYTKFSLGMIGTAKWGGVVLNDLFKDAGIDIEGTDKKHVVFEGYDTGPDGKLFGVSLPIDLVREMKEDILLAYQMNGEYLTRDHGFPVRLIIPGVAGVRSVKWLRRITLSDKQCQSYYQRCDYRGFHSSVTMDNVRFCKGQPIWKLPVTSVICDPPHNSMIPDGARTMTIRGYAWSGGGRGIVRVDVSPDGGDSWLNATLTPPEQQTPYTSWAWTFWEVEIPIPQPELDRAEAEAEAVAAGEPKPEKNPDDEEEELLPIEVIVKAVDVSSNVQPDSVEGIWNLRGVLNNAWHRILIHYKIPEVIEEIIDEEAIKIKKKIECGDKCKPYYDHIAELESKRVSLEDEDEENPLHEAKEGEEEEFEEEE